MNSHQHIIINIGRQVGSGGNKIAQMLANQFACTCYDKELLNLAAKESGFSETFFEQNDEQRGFLRSIFHPHAPLISDNNFYNNKFSQESLFQFQSNAIIKAAEQGNCVFVGRAADYVLRDLPNTANIFITASLEDRMKAVAQRRECSEEEARRMIEVKESNRSSFYNYYTGKKWGHCENYDLCINTSVLGIENSCEIIAAFIKKKFNC